ncbi:MAG: MBL fold metallo-hydrolase [Chloroflexi bacterium]|nr:MBL fold metallo-hydrolase [Chloroflexota bacterium]
MEIVTITPKLRLLNLAPPIPGYERFIGAYLLHGEKSAIVDVGPRSAIPSLVGLLPSAGVSPGQVGYIILTHIHIDHAGGAGTALKALSRARVIAHPRARPHLVEPSSLWRASLQTLGELAARYGEIEPVPAERLIDASDGMKIDLGGGLVLEVYLTPGHAPHHLSVFDRAESVLLAGETAGVCLDGKAIRLATPPPFYLEEALASIDKLIALEPARLCYGHFGCYPDGAGRLGLMRRKIVQWYEIVGTAARDNAGPERIFDLLREHDRGLDYLKELSPEEYARERQLILNCIRGLAGAALRETGT